VSKYGLEQIKPMAADSIDLKGVKKIAPAKVSSDENIVQSKDIQVIRLNSGNIRITTRKDKDK
jgi:hypothetical protein